MTDQNGGSAEQQPKPRARKPRRPELHEIGAAERAERLARMSPEERALRTEEFTFDPEIRRMGSPMPRAVDGGEKA